MDLRNVNILYPLSWFAVQREWKWTTALLPSRLFAYAAWVIPLVLFVGLIFPRLVFNLDGLLGPSWFVYVVIWCGILLFLAVYAWTFWDNGFKVKSGPPSDRLLKILLADLDRARAHGKKAIGVAVSGEGQPIAYSVDVLDMFSHVGLKGCLQVIAGPLFMLDDRNPGAAPPLMQMVRMGYVELYVAIRRVKRHFVADSSGLLYAEELHAPLQSMRAGLLSTKWGGYAS